MKRKRRVTPDNSKQSNCSFYSDCRTGMNIEAESNKRFFEQLIEERVLNRKYGGESRRNHSVNLTFLTDGDEYLYPMRNDLSTIDGETFAYVQELATNAGIGVLVEDSNSIEAPHRALVALSGVPVSRFFRNAVLECFPGLNKHPGYWTLFCYLLFGSWHDEHTSRLLLYAPILSEIEGRDRDNSQAE